MQRFLARVTSVVVLFAATVTGCADDRQAHGAPVTYPVGLRQVEFGERHLALNIFYPAQPPTEGAKPFPMPMFTNLEFYSDLAPAIDGKRRPLILFSHGRGSNGLYYAWFAQHLASRGFIVAALNHYRANTYDSSIVYLANKLWQRPMDLSLTADFLLSDPSWSPLIDANRIGVAGHSQGGFTSLWIGGARVNADRFLAFQQHWKNNLSVPADLREQMPLDPAPALNVADPRIKAAFAMAPGIIKDFGVDEEGLRQLTRPTYITVGAADTQTPPAENAEFAANNIPGAQLAVIPGAVDHEIFVNECDQSGRDELPEACIDAPGVDRVAIHREVADAAVEFFGTHLGT